jgi:galactonate dehydratase
MPQFSAQQVLKRARLTAAVVAGRTHRPSPDISITDLKATAVSEPVSKRISILVQVSTDAGIEGVAELAVGSDVGSTLAAVNKRKAEITGRDAQGRQSLLWELSQSGDESGNSFLAALDIALHDIAGKISKAPVYEVVAGATRSKARALARLDGGSESELMRALDWASEAGHRAFIVPLSLPGDGIRGRQFYRDTRQLLERLREAAGEESDFAIDCQGKLKPAQAAYLARELESFRLLWLDEPSNQTTDTARQRVATESVTPVGLGRMSSNIADFQSWLRNGSLDVVRPDVCKLGIDAIRKLAAQAETHYVAVAPVVTGGPIATAAGLQVAASIPNFFMLEVPLPQDAKDRAMRKELLSHDMESVKDGFLSLPTGPGLGITLNEDALKRYKLSL